MELFFAELFFSVLRCGVDEVILWRHVANSDRSVLEMIAFTALSSPDSCFALMGGRYVIPPGTRDTIECREVRFPLDLEEWLRAIDPAKFEKLVAWRSLSDQERAEQGGRKELCFRVPSSAVADSIHVARRSGVPLPELLEMRFDELLALVQWSNEKAGGWLSLRFVC